MKWRVWLLVLLLSACSKVSEENFAKIREGMSEEQVVAILGKPTDSMSLAVRRGSGMTARWVGNGATITVRFVNGQVALKSFDKAPQK